MPGERTPDNSNSVHLPVQNPKAQILKQATLHFTTLAYIFDIEQYLIQFSRW
jgi:hypothetical protein